MIQIVAKNVVKQERINEFIEIAKQLVKETNEKDAGCIQYELFQNLKTTNEFTILEKWEDMSFVKAHMENEHFIRTMEQLKDFYVEEAQVNLYQQVL